MDGIASLQEARVRSVDTRPIAKAREAVERYAPLARAIMVNIEGAMAQGGVSIAREETIKVLLSEDPEDEEEDEDDVDNMEPEQPTTGENAAHSSIGWAPRPAAARKGSRRRVDVLNPQFASRDDIWKLVLRQDIVARWLRRQEAVPNAYAGGEYDMGRGRGRNFRTQRVLSLDEFILDGHYGLRIVARSDLEPKFQDMYVQRYLTPFIRDLIKEGIIAGLVVVRVVQWPSGVTAPEVVPAEACRIDFRRTKEGTWEYLAYDASEASAPGPLRGWDPENAIPNSKVFVLDRPGLDGFPRSAIISTLESIEANRAFKDTAVQTSARSTQPVVVAQQPDQDVSSLAVRPDQATPGDGEDIDTRALNTEDRLRRQLYERSEQLANMCNGRGRVASTVGGKGSSLRHEVLPPGQTSANLYVPSESFAFINFKDVVEHEIAASVGFPITWFRAGGADGRGDFLAFTKRALCLSMMSGRYTPIIEDVLNRIFGGEDTLVRVVLPATIPQEDVDKLRENGMLKWEYARRIITERNNLPTDALVDAQPVTQETREKIMLQDRQHKLRLREIEEQARLQAEAAVAEAGEAAAAASDANGTASDESDTEPPPRKRQNAQKGAKQRTGTRGAETAKRTEKAMDTRAERAVEGSNAKGRKRARGKKKKKQTEPGHV